MYVNLKNTKDIIWQTTCYIACIKQKVLGFVFVIAWPSVIITKVQWGTGVGWSQKNHINS